MRSGGKRPQGRDRAGSSVQRTQDFTLKTDANGYFKSPLFQANRILPSARVVYITQVVTGIGVDPVKRRLKLQPATQSAVHRR